MPETGRPHEYCGKCPMYCWLTLEDAMDYMKVKKTTLYKYIGQGLKVSNINGKMRFLQRDLDDFIMVFRK
jgi:hypothetical protein